MNKDKYTLLLINEDNLDQNINLDELNKVFICSNNENENIMYDVIFDTKDLEVYHGFNKELILKLDNGTKLSEEDKNLIIKEIKELDFDISFAIEMLGGSRKVFENILINYLAEYGNIEETITKLLEVNDYENIRKIVHKIKGVSSYIGSEKSLYLTEILEYRLSNNLATTENIYEFIKYHNRILGYVKERV